MQEAARSRTLPLPGILPTRREPLPLIGEQGDIRYYATRARSVLNPPESTGMEYWSINPYVGCAFGCSYCYARYAHRYALERAVAASDAGSSLEQDAREMAAWLAFERRVFVKENAPAVLRNSLRNGGEKHLELVRGQTLVIGTATDPYQPAERRYRITRGILEVLSQHPGLRISIITKSPLVTRDLDMISRISARSRISVHISLITADRELARRLEPRSPTPEARLRAVARLRSAGINAGVFCMPVLPGITDHPAALDDLVRRAAEAGATHFVADALRLRSSARARYLPVIAREFPTLLERYERSYRGSYQLSSRYRDGLHDFVAKLCSRHGIARRTRDVDLDDDDEPRSLDEQLEFWQPSVQGGP